MLVIIYYPDTTTHLSLALTGMGKEKNLYISCFPDNDSGNHSGVRLHRFKDDSPSHTPAHIVILPTEESCGYGLAEQAIYDWWKNDFKPKQEFFELFGNNCATIVYRALCAGQLGSATLNNQLLMEKNWFCTPSNISEYAKELGQMIAAGKSNENKLFFQFHELKECCKFAKLGHAFDQARALFLRLEQFNTQGYSLTINKPFCDGIKNILDCFKTELNNQFGNVENIDPLIKLCALDDDLNTIDISHHFSKLNTLANYIYLDYPMLIEAFQQTIKNELLTPIVRMITNIQPAFLTSTKSIESTLQQVGEQIDDDQNPHKICFKRNHIGFQRF